MQEPEPIKPHEDLEVEIANLRQTVKKYVDREWRLKNIEIIGLVKAMIGEEMYDSLDDDSKVIYIQMAKKGRDYFGNLIRLRIGVQDECSILTDF